MPVAARLATMVLGLSALVAAGWLVPAPTSLPAPVPAATPNDPAVTMTQPTALEQSNDESIASAVAEQWLPSAAGWLNSDTVWANDDAAYPIASLTKLVTALVGLEHEPIAPGEVGTVHVWDESDTERQYELLALDGIAFPIPIGTEVTRQQMLTLMLVPSANDFAMSYAYSVFGDNETFVEAVNAWKVRQGLDSLQIVEPSGMASENVANAADLVRISQLALAQPVVAEIIDSESAVLPWGIGEVMNSNPLFGVMPGVVGVKTGFTFDAGYNLAAAVQTNIEGYSFTAIAVVLGRDSAESYAEDAELLLSTLTASPPISMIAEVPVQSTEVPIHIENAPLPADFWWRITHPLMPSSIGGASPVT